MLELASRPPAKPCDLELNIVKGVRGSRAGFLGNLLLSACPQGPPLALRFLDFARFARFRPLQVPHFGRLQLQATKSALGIKSKRGVIQEGRKRWVESPSAGEYPRLSPNDILGYSANILGYSANILGYSANILGYSASILGYRSAERHFGVTLQHARSAPPEAGTWRGAPPGSAQHRSRQRT